MSLKVYTHQESRILNGQMQQLHCVGEGVMRPRIDAILKDFRNNKPRLSIDRALWFTRGYKANQHLPLNLRWARAMDAVFRNIAVHIGSQELIVGRGGPVGRYGVLYPELEGGYFAQIGKIPLEEEGRPYLFTAEDVQVLNEEIVPFWIGRTFHEAHGEIMPSEVVRLLWNNDDIYDPSFIVHQTATLRHSIQWVLDYKKVLQKGFFGIKEDALQKIDELDIDNSEHNFNKLPFYKAVITICDGIVAFAQRYSQEAISLAQKEIDAKRKAELELIAATCAHVPEHPARTFHEAIQSQWFTQLASRFEQIHGGIIGNGRVDQYFYPYYQKDKQDGILDDEHTLELLELLWLNIAQSIRIQPSPAGFKIYEGNAHFETTTVGGVDKNGKDASNELSYLVLQTKKELPLDYPDLAVRIHSATPDRFLAAVCDLIKEGTGFPKIMNDEDIIPVLLSKGARLDEARDYNPSGCTEVRLANRSTYFTGTTWLNLGAVMELTLRNGRMKKTGDRLISIETGNPLNFKSFEKFFTAFKTQLTYIQKQIFIQQYLADTLRPDFLAAPFLSSLHDLCMVDGKDVNQGTIKDGMSLGGQTAPVGFGTVIDSLAAVRHIVYEEKTVSMDALLESLENDFEDAEMIRQRCLKAPKFGNLIQEVDELGRDLEEIMLAMFDKHTNAYGGRPEMMYVPVTSHIPMGRVVSATPNGRKAGVALSEGISPTQGADISGPTTTISSIAATKFTPGMQRAARLLNIKLTPQAVAGERGTRNLAQLIRCICEQKHWHVQFSVINRETLLAARKDPEKFRNLLVRVAGYSAFFVDLSPALQQEIIERTEHDGFA